MAKSPDFLIEIGRNVRALGIDEPYTDILGLVPNVLGKYRVDGIEVQVCPTSRPKHSSALQKVIIRESGKNRRRVALIHHNANSPVIHDLSATVSLALRIRRVSK